MSKIRVNYTPENPPDDAVKYGDYLPRGVYRDMDGDLLLVLGPECRVMFSNDNGLFDAHDIYDDDAALMPTDLSVELNIR